MTKWWEYHDQYCECPKCGHTWSGDGAIASKRAKICCPSCSRQSWRKDVIKKGKKREDE